MSLGTAPNPLTHRLAAVRRRLRVTAAWRGAASVLAVLAVGLTLLGLLDWRMHLPGPVRAFGLTAVLAAAGVLLYRLLFRPLTAPADDLSLALRIEAIYPELNDGLASAVQFLEQPAETDRKAASFRQAAVWQALKLADNCDFNKAVDGRGVVLAGVALLLGLAPVAALAKTAPVLSQTALVRLTDPFGEHDWPLRTRWSDITARTRIGRGEPFEIRAVLHDEIPETALVRIATDDLGPPAELSFPIGRGDGAAGALLARLDATRTQRSFHFQLVANDAVTPWHSVAVLTPPGLAPLHDRPSPQVSLTFPRYTDLPVIHLPDGGSNIEAVAGTQVTLEAATDRPVVAAWVAFTPDSPRLPTAALLAPLGASHPFQAAALRTVGEPVWIRPTPDGSRSLLKVDFTPWMSGTYALHVEDDAGLGSNRLFEVRIFPDPAPVVALERPSASLDNLLVLPDAEVTVRIAAEDAQYALRSVVLEYRGEKNALPGRHILYDHQTTGAGLATVLTRLAGPVPTPTGPVKLRPQRLERGERFALTAVRVPDGSPEGRPLREGDVVTLQAAADDFDNVALDKQPGRSNEVELRVVGLPALELLLQQAQAQVQQELLRLREMQREGHNKVDALEKQWRNTGKLRDEDLDALLQAEQTHEQIRGRIGTPREGLRAEAAKILRTLRDNHMRNAGARERMEMVAGELDRLARDELPSVAPLLTQARKENELAGQAPAARRNPLAEAGRHQEEVERTLNDLLARLDPFSTTRQLRAEAKEILRDEEKLLAQTELLKKFPPAADPMTAPEWKQAAQFKADLERVAEAQQRTANRLEQMLSKLQKMAADKTAQADDKRRLADDKERSAKEKERQAKESADPEKAAALTEEARALRKEAAELREAGDALANEAQALDQAANTGFDRKIKQQMTAAAQHLKPNSPTEDARPNEAARAQADSVKAVKEVVQALEDRREEELDKLVKKMRNAEKKMAELLEDEDRLVKKTREARKIADPQEREAELKKLAREQERLHKETQEMARELSRLRAGAAGQQMARAEEAMEEAGQKLERGDAGEDRQEEALQQMKQAQQELKQARKDAEEDLGREKLVKIADQVKRIRDRQESLLQETVRIQDRILAVKDWKATGLIGSVGGARDNQRDLAKESTELAQGKLASAKVFARLLERAADAMTNGATALDERFKKHPRGAGPAFERAQELADDLTVRRPQTDALRLLDQMLAALKPEDGPNGPAGPDGQGGQAGGGAGRESDGIPPLAQLKALKAFQEDVRQRTEAFAQKHPNPKAANLPAPDQEELAALKRDQAAISDLLDDLAAPPEREGGKP